MRRLLTPDRLLVAGVTLVGLLLLGAAAWTTFAELSFRAGASMTEARVVEMRARTSRGSDGRDSTMFHPVFEFALPDGETVRAVAPLGSGTPCCEVGDVVTIRYDPARPQRAVQDRFVDSWLLPTVLGAFGSIVFGIGALFWWGMVWSPVQAAPRFPQGGLARITQVRALETPDGPRWVVEARLTDPLTKQERVFEGAPLDFDPRECFTVLPSLSVRYDPAPGGSYALSQDILSTASWRKDRASRRDVTRLNGIALDGSEPMPRSLPVTLLCIGGALLLAAVALAWPQLAYRFGTARAPGQVVEMRHTSSGSAPVFTFTPEGGREVRVVSRIYSHPPCCREGQAVTVLYVPQDPRRARIAGLQDDWLLPGFVAGFALLWLVPGLMALRARWIYRRRGGAAPAPRAARPAARAVDPPGHGVKLPLVGLRRAETAQGPRWFVQARWSDAAGASRLIESDPLPFDPVPQMAALDHVRVRFDGDPATAPFRIDLSFLRPPG